MPHWRGIKIIMRYVMEIVACAQRSARSAVAFLCCVRAMRAFVTGSIVQTGFVYKRRVRHAVGKFSAATIYLCIFIYSLKTVLNYKNISDT